MFSAPFSVLMHLFNPVPVKQQGSTSLFHNVSNCWPDLAKSLLDFVKDKRLVCAAHYGKSLQEGPPSWNVEMLHEDSIQDEISGTNFCIDLKENAIKIESM